MNLRRPTLWTWVKTYLLHPIAILDWLVVEPYPSETYEFVNWDDDIPNRWTLQIHGPNMSKPATSGGCGGNQHPFASCLAHRQGTPAAWCQGFSALWLQPRSARRCCQRPGPPWWRASPALKLRAVLMGKAWVSRRFPSDLKIDVSNWFLGLRMDLTQLVWSGPVA